MARRLYPANGLPVLIRVTPLAAPDTDERLALLGFESIHASVVMTARPSLTSPDPTIVIAAGPEPAWLAGYARAAALSGSNATAQGALLGRLREPAAFATLTEGGRGLGFGIAISGLGETGLFNIVTDPAARGRGVAQRITAALLAWGAARRDTRAYLQVHADNGPALASYHRAGFSVAYPYHYRILR